MENSKPKQTERVKEFMEVHGSITQKDAFEVLGIYRLASRISELRKTHDIVSEMVEVTNRFGEKCRVASYRFAK